MSIDASAFFGAITMISMMPNTMVTPIIKRAIANDPYEHIPQKIYGHTMSKSSIEKNSIALPILYVSRSMRYPAHPMRKNRIGHTTMKTHRGGIPLIFSYPALHPLWKIPPTDVRIAAIIVAMIAIAGLISTNYNINYKWI